MKTTEENLLTNERTACSCMAFTVDSSRMAEMQQLHQKASGSKQSKRTVRLKTPLRVFVSVGVF